jgi:hypothetical protein
MGVEHMTHNLKIEGSNPVTMHRESENHKKQSNFFDSDECNQPGAMTSGSSIVVDLTHNPKIEGSNPATGTGGENIKE